MMRWSTIIWIAALAGVVLMYLSIYPTFAHDANLTKTLFDNFPPAFKAAFSIDVDTLLSFLGFFAFTFTNLTLIASIHAMYTGVNLLSRESRSKTTDFLLTKPRRRATIYCQKLCAGVTIIVVTWGILYGTAFGLAKAFGAGNFNVHYFTLLMLSLLIVQLWFLICGFLAAQQLPRLKSTIPVTLAVVFGFFMIGMLAAIINDTHLRYFSPFKFFNYVDIVAGKGYELVYLVIAGISVLVMLVASYILYTKRDVRAAE